MSVDSIMRVAGKAVAATSPITIAGTEAGSGTNVASLPGTTAETEAVERERPAVSGRSRAVQPLVD
jgi:hypothetical protein